VTDADLRALVRDAVARHFAGGVPAVGVPPADVRPPALELRGAALEPQAAPGPHVSHAIYITLVNTGDACVIEPGVGCDHCGYCKSHGH
jgi:hypothetical protein